MPLLYSVVMLLTKIWFTTLSNWALFVAAYFSTVYGYKHIDNIGYLCINIVFAGKGRLAVYDKR